eukprot:1264691-Amphidinium_carterae.1
MSSSKYMIVSFSAQLVGWSSAFGAVHSKSKMLGCACGRPRGARSVQIAPRGTNGPWSTIPTRLRIEQCITV